MGRGRQDGSEEKRSFVCVMVSKGVCSYVRKLCVRQRGDPGQGPQMDVSLFGI